MYNSANQQLSWFICKYANQKLIIIRGKSSTQKLRRIVCMAATLLAGSYANTKLARGKYATGEAKPDHL